VRFPYPVADNAHRTEQSPTQHLITRLSRNMRFHYLASANAIRESADLVPKNPPPPAAITT
jgi:hypothetical protein